MAGRLAYDAINIDACMFDFQPNNDARTSVACIDLLKLELVVTISDYLCPKIIKQPKSMLTPGSNERWQCSALNYSKAYV